MATEQQPVCGFDGNPDLYGLGLRLGFYIQAASTTLAMMALYRETIYIWSSSIAFVMATFVVLLRDTILKTLYAQEVALVTWLLIFQVGRLVPLIAGVERYGVNLMNQGLLFLFSVLSMAIHGYFVWFWNVGLDAMPRTTCDEYAFAFARVDLRGGFRTFNKVWFNFFTGVMGLILIAYLIGAAYFRLKPAEKEKIPAQAAANKGKTSQVPGKKTIGFMAFWFVVSTPGLVAAVEMQIKWNDIRGVHRLDSPGQLIPFLLSLGQLLHVSYSILRGQDSLEDHLAEKPIKGDVPPCPMTLPAREDSGPNDAERGEGGVLMEPTSPSSQQDSRLNAAEGDLLERPVEPESDAPLSPISREERELEESVALTGKWMAQVAGRDPSA